MISVVQNNWYDTPMTDHYKQKICVFQQNGSGEGKIKAIRHYAADLIELRLVSIDDSLPVVIDDSEGYLSQRQLIDPENGRPVDMVLDFLKHPDLSHDLARLCSELQVPVVASGKKHRIAGVATPPT